MRLDIKSHADCLILMEAIREYCNKQSRAFQMAYEKYLKDDPEQAACHLRMRKEIDTFSWNNLRKLENIRKKFEDER